MLYFVLDTGGHYFAMGVLFPLFIFSRGRGDRPFNDQSVFLNNSRLYQVIHILAMLVLFVGIAGNVSFLVFVWPLFCLFGLFWYLRTNHQRLLSFYELVTFIPFAFSLIASIWLVSAENDFQLLGYNKAWSFYACLHSSYLGWIFVGCLAYLSLKSGPWSRFYAIGCYVSFVSFLLVAFGIDGVPIIKPVGVIAFTLLVPFFIGLFYFSLKKEQKFSRFCSLVSLFGVILTLGLALAHEFFRALPEVTFQAPTMVAIHGLINALIVIPALYLAVRGAGSSSN